MYLVCLGFAVAVVHFSRKFDWLAFFKRSDHPDLHTLLLRSSEINREYAEINIKFQTSMQAIRSQEVDRLRVISEHLTHLHQSVRLLDEEIQ